VNPDEDMNFFKTIFRKPTPIIQSINVVKYPNKIVFETYNQIKNSYSIRTTEISILESDSSNIEIGKAILKHLSLSKVVRKVSDEDSKVSNENYKKITGLKSMKSQMKDALSVHISRKNNEIEFFPTVNGGTAGNRKGFHFSEEKFMIEDSENYELIGKTFNLALDKCK